MSTLHPLPDEASVRQMLAMLFGNDLEINSGSPVATDTGKCMVAVYLNDDDQPVSACVCDHSFAAFAGSALTRIPVGGAEDAVESGDFSSMMLGNVREIMNICSRLFMGNESPHLRLDSVYASTEETPAEILTMIDSCPGRADLNIVIPGYGSGALSLVTT